MSQLLQADGIQAELRRIDAIKTDAWLIVLAAQ